MQARKIEWQLWAGLFLVLATGPEAGAAGFVTNTPMLTMRYSHTATLLASGQILVAGGSSTNNIVADAELYDPATGKWRPTGPMITARTEHTATLLPDGKVLVVGGYGTNVLMLASAELYDPQTGSWTNAGSMSQGRYQHTATLLSNGKLLVAGGAFFSSYLSSAEIFDPATGTWSTTGSMNSTRTLHTATLLPNGQVLAAAGFGSNIVWLTSAELYDPGTGLWSFTGPLATARGYHTATLLPSGKVLVASGFAGSGGFLTNAELYNPASGAWTSTGPLTTGRSQATATLLPNGRVMVAGGYKNPNTLASVELYNPATGTWSPTNSLVTMRLAHTATLLASGRVLIAGGSVGTYFATNTTELFDASNGGWSAAGSLNTARIFHTSTLLTNGKVLIAGGRDSGFSPISSAELYQPASNNFVTTISMLSPRRNHTATLLPNGKVLVAGGFSTNYLPTAELYDPLGGWTGTSPLSVARASHTATLLASGKVLVAGGDGLVGVTNSAEVFDPSNNVWQATGTLKVARDNHTATLLTTGQVLVSGGFSNGVILASAELFNPASNLWSLTNPMNVARYSHTATLLANGMVLVAGGQTSLGATNAAELFDPVTGTWTRTGSLVIPRYNHMAMLLPNGDVLVAGGSATGGYVANAELYDPGSGKWTPTGSLTPARENLTATLLANGKVLTAGGFNGSHLATAQLFDLGLGFSSEWQPQIFSATTPVSAGTSLMLSGAGFRGISSASGANTTQDSATDYPLVQVRSVESGEMRFVSPANFSDSNFSSRPITGMPAGQTLVTVFVNGIPSSNSLFVAFQPTSTNNRDFGVDVSHFQASAGIPQNDWNQIASEGKRFVFIKATEGLTGPDDQAMAANLAGATTAGILAGVYHFAHPENRPAPAGGVQEADHLLAYAGSAIGAGYLRPVLDLEANAATLSTTALTDWVLAFAGEITAQRGAGAAPIIYCTQAFANNELDNRLAGFDLWLRTVSSADPASGDPPGQGFANPLGVFTNWSFWQYSDTGISGGLNPVDLDVCHSEYKPLASFLIPPAPSLTITQLASAVLISWPLGAGGYRLESAGVLTQPSPWTTVPPPFVTNGATISVTIPITSSNRFYRLHAL